MITLKEIESAVTLLPAPQQRSLLMWLGSVVATGPVQAVRTGGNREAWLQKLVERRERGRTGITGTPLQQIIDGLRAHE